MIIEKLQPQYVPQTVELLQQLAPFAIDPDSAKTLYDTLVDREDCCVLVAREGDEILGTVSGFCSRSLVCALLTIDDVIVREDIRGRGVGKKLMEAIDEYGRSCGCKYSLLVSSGFRTRAHHFYESLGYTEDVRGFRKFL